MRVRSALALPITLAACNMSPSSGPAPHAPDAPVSTSLDSGLRGDAAVPPDAFIPDASPPTVLAVVCPATVPLTVDAPDTLLMFVLTPGSGMIALNGVVKFTMH